MPKTLTWGLAGGLLLFTAAAAAYDDKSDVQQRLNESAQVLTDMLAGPDTGIPEQLLERAQCVVVIPNMKRAALVAGARYGAGFEACRTGSGWSAPSGVQIEGGSLGAQIGVKETDLVLMAMNQSARDMLLQPSVNLGVTAAVQAGPVGRAAFTANANMYVWARSGGAFAELSVSGVTLETDNGANQALYSREVPAREILTGAVQPPPDANAFMAALGGGGATPAATGSMNRTGSGSGAGSTPASAQSGNAAVSQSGTTGHTATQSETASAPSSSQTDTGAMAQDQSSTTQQSGSVRSNTGQAATQQYDASAEGSGPGSSLESESAKASRMAIQMLQHTNQARMGIRNQNLDHAKTEVDRALSIARDIPTTATTGAAGNTVPIYAEFATSAVIGPLEAASGRAASKTKRTEPRTDNDTSSAAAIRDVETGYTSISVDVGMARDHLQAAKQALENGNAQKADSALAAVQSGVALLSVEQDRPLIKARANLDLAHSLAQSGKYEDARAPLQTAANALAAYSGAHSQDASSIRNDINSFLQNFDQNQAQAAQKIEQWWDRTADWSRVQSAQTRSNQP